MKRRREMKKLFYRPQDAWVGDLIPYWENGTYYGFYLHDPRNRDKEYAEETTWHLVKTKNFVDLEDAGEAIQRGGDDQPNKNAYTGSVIKDKNGIYHAFYTAYNEAITIDGKSIQSVMQAVGPDPEHLETMEDFRLVSDGRTYEEFDWRDPFVFWNEDEQCYFMLVTTRIKNGGALRGGCIALCRSDDLISWSYEEPFYSPGMYITMECPEIFKMGPYWYLVFSTFSDRFATHYRISDSWKGPWKIPENDTFDSRADYAIKTASDGEKRFAFGWIASKYGEKDFGPWEWGGTMVFHEIVQNKETGELGMRMIPAAGDLFSRENVQAPLTTYNCRATKDGEKITIESDTLGCAMYPVEESSFMLEVDIHVEQAAEFGVALHTDEGLERGYFLRMNTRNGQMAWDMWPRTEPGKYQWQIEGDVPYQVETVRNLPKGSDFHLQIIREDDICVVYLNDTVALSTRMYDHKGGYAGIYVLQGSVEANNYIKKRRVDYEKENY